MALEAATHLDELVSTNPTGSDDRSTADDHLRLIKAVLQTDFPNITGAMTASQAELNVLDGYTGNTADLNILAGADTGGLTAAELLYVNGVTSGIQAQIDAKAPLASPALTGNPTAPTPTAGDDDTSIATTAFVRGEIGAELSVPAGGSYLGTGDDGTLTVASSASIDSGEYHYTSLTIDASVVWTVNHVRASFILIRCTGTVTINGEINADAKAANGGASGDAANAGGGGGGTHGGGAGGSGAADSGVSAGKGGDGQNVAGKVDGGAGGAGARNGTPGEAASADPIYLRETEAKVFLEGGYGAGGGGGADNNSGGGDGGAGGGGIIIVADTIVFGASSVLSAEGQGGSSSGGKPGGSGGGGIIAYIASTITDNGVTTSVIGGAATVSTRTGGAGGDGTVIAITRGS